MTYGAEVHVVDKDSGETLDVITVIEDEDSTDYID